VRVPPTIADFESIEQTDDRLHRRGRLSDWRQWLTSFVLHVLMVAVLAIVAIPAGVGNLSLSFTADVSDADIALPDTINVLPGLSTNADEETFDQSLASQSSVDLLDSSLMISVDSRMVQQETGNVWNELTMLESTQASPDQLVLSSNIPNTIGTRKTNAIRSLSNVGGAIDTIGREIGISLRSNRTLVVWLFDQSPSLITQRERILEQLEKVYDDLEGLKFDSELVFADQNRNELLTQVAAFGENYDQAMTAPVKVFEPVKRAIRRVLRDDSGVENVMSSVLETVSRYRGLSRVSKGTGKRKCNIVIVVITDEAGDDVDRLEEAIGACQRASIPVYAIGVPAPFGEQESEISWQDPDVPNSPVVPAIVNQGPESLVFERIAVSCRLGTQGRQNLRKLLPPPVDSGFGPFGLTRLSRETGGIYFAVHPSRGGSTQGWDGVATFAAHLTQFYSHDVMKEYEPDYVSEHAFNELLDQWPLRRALVEESRRSTSGNLILRTDRFIFKSTFARQIAESKKSAKAYAKRLERVYRNLSDVEIELQHEPSVRWRANYSLAMANVEGALARLYSWMALLEMLDRRRPSFDMADESRTNNLWRISESNQLMEDERVYSMVAAVKKRCQKLIKDHPGTPWASMAQWEMDVPFGFHARQSYRGPSSGGRESVEQPPQRL
jgi:hypothetical protein